MDLQAGSPKKRIARGPGTPTSISGAQSFSAPKFSLVLADNGFCFYAFDNFSLPLHSLLHPYPTHFLTAL
jgi:hypothetical protein